MGGRSACGDTRRGTLVTAELHYSNSADEVERTEGFSGRSGGRKGKRSWKTPSKFTCTVVKYSKSRLQLSGLWYYKKCGVMDHGETCFIPRVDINFDSGVG
jgi:hypothetical protein